MKGFLLFFLLAPALSWAQTTEIQKVADEISTADLKANVYKLASPEMEGRQAGSHGDTLAAEYIAGWFKKYKLQAPYNNATSFFQPVPLQKIVLTKGELNTAGKKYRQFDDWYIFPGNTYKTVRFDSMPVVFAGFGIESDRYNDLLGIDVTGKAVIILQAQPSDSLAELLSSATRSTISADYMKNLEKRGAAAVLVVTGDFERASRALKNAGALRSYRNPATTLNQLPRIYVSEKMINELLLQNDVSLKSLEINMRRIDRPLSFQTKTAISINLQIDSIREQAPNVIGIIKGKDTAAAAVVISTHHDHLGKRGSQVYFGAADNASGSASLMEIAKLVQKAVQSGLRPKRSIIFVSFTGEKSGLMGSYYYTQHPVYAINKTWAAFNIDILGRADSFHTGKMADSNYIYFFASDTLGHGLENAFITANNSVKLKLEDWYQKPEAPNRWLPGSDSYPFYQNGVPVIYTSSGVSKGYNPLTDIPDTLDYSLLTLQTKLAFLALWNIANK